MYTIQKRVNNNVVMATRAQQQYVLVGKGIGFKVYPKDLLSEERVSEVFVSSENFNLKTFVALIDEMSTKEVGAARKIIQEGEKFLNKSLNPNLIVPLLDHLHYAIKRFESRQFTASPIDWEIRNMYPIETQIGMKAIAIIEEMLGLRLPDSESVFFALHFVNIQFDDETISDTVAFTEFMHEINQIIKYQFQKELDESSSTYQRFITHVRYFFVRQKNGEDFKLGNEELYHAIKKRFHDESVCVNKIVAFIDKRLGITTSVDEKLYLILHINRLIT
ncbi:transcriptional antiterminator [Lactococcus hodotermopsidis]|uniref:Transcriptional antiterminator n=1 Tax=Pseudolactococcus hodotermopsidis TaxID=2709157 RepID=A0A6A0BB00_9LACT|nr:PRD domain-containing protein [Lactococcus hodotermopsidis]GFH41833.1 transcriptional antiterminator [Lactococcus hodotermopsidis]